MAIYPPIAKHIDEWIGTFPSAWWIYFRLRSRGYLSPGASGAAVRRVIREAIRLNAEEAGPGLPRPGASWNTLVPEMLWSENLLSSKGEDMAMWMPEESFRSLPPEAAAELRRQLKEGSARCRAPSR